MSKAVVVFQSKYGSTRKYAQWIAEELSCELLERKSTKISDLEQYDTIIYGGGLYAGGVDYAMLTGEEIEMIDTYGKSVDFIDKATIVPIADYVREVH